MKDLVRNQLQHSITTLNSLMNDENIADTLIRAAELTSIAMKNGNKLMVAGNGGSAADSQHLVAEFVSRLTVDRPALPAIALTTDTSILTAIGNDYSYDNVFERQIAAIARRGDVLLAISTSGNAKNILNALHLCQKLGVTTVGYTGESGGLMMPLCDLSIRVPSSTTMQIQESHLALEHIFCMLVERFYFGMDFGKLPHHVSE